MRDDRITFSWDGETVEARPGEPISVALWRAGVRTQTRSIKFHRARGPQCFTGDCPGCMIRVDGVPNVRGCRTGVREGMRVESQVGVPSARHDVLSVVDRVFTHFDHERDFVRPGPVRAVYEAVARRLAGFGTEPTGDVEVREGRALEADVLVVGGGPAGLLAAHAASEAGAEVLLADEDGFGGCLRHTPREVASDAWGRAPGPRLAEQLIDAVASPVHRIDGTVFGIYEDATALAEVTRQGWAVHTVDAKALVIAAGATEGPVLLDGSDRPGVLPARAARILMNRWNVPPGERIAVIEPGREGLAFAREAEKRGSSVEELSDVEAIDGSPDVTGVRTSTGRTEADAAVVDPGLTPAPELGRQAGVPYTYEAPLGGRVPLAGPNGATRVPNVYVVGSAAGVHVPEGALMQGRWAGRAAAQDPVDVDPDRLLEVAKLTREERDALERVWRMK